MASDSILLRQRRKSASHVENRINQVEPRGAQHAILKAAAGRCAIWVRPILIKTRDMHNGFGRIWQIRPDPENDEI